VSEMEIEQQYTVAELAKMLKMRPATVRTWIREGVITAGKFGGEHGDWRIPETEVRRLVNDAYGSKTTVTEPASE
jgi:excisionase family DNA binding protein